MKEKYDFSGWATVIDRKCSDGRTIRKGAFAEQDGQIVPLVWQHDHADPTNVLGHCLLEARPEGMYTYGSFNNTERGQNAREQVAHGDITSLSIHANRLQQKGGDVLHGVIREVSLVMAGANPGAWIDVPVIEHADGSIADSDEATIYMGEALELYHEEESSDDGAEEKENEVAEDKKERTVEDVYNEFDEEQKAVVDYLVGSALEEAGYGGEEGEVDHSENEGEDEMKHNVFDEDTRANGNYLSHEDMAGIFKDAKRLGSLRDAVNEFTEANELSHDDDPPRYGIMVDPNRSDSTYGINYLFPDYKELNSPPEFINYKT